MIKHEWGNIGCYVYPNAYIYADRTKSEDGSYQEVARVLKCPAKIEYREGHEIPEQLKRSAEEDLKCIWDGYEKTIESLKNCTFRAYKEWNDFWTIYALKENYIRTIMTGMSDENVEKVKALCKKHKREFRERILF